MQINPNQVSNSVVGMSSAVFTSIAAALVTTALKSNTLIDKSFNTVIHGVSAAEHISRAGELRAEIYAAGIEKNGALAQRESELKHLLRVRNLEKQEEASRPVANASKRKTASK